MTIYFGSDLHFSHNKILEFTDRSFSSLKEMEDIFFGEMYSKIRKGDDIYLLGDIVLYKDMIRILDWLQDIPGNFHLIKGNHDHKETVKHPVWKSVEHYKELKHPDLTHKIVLCHFPIESWNKQRYGAYHFHGHTHNNMSNEIKHIKNRWDVGYDATGRVLSTLQEIIKPKDTYELY